MGRKPTTGVPKEQSVPRSLRRFLPNPYTFPAVIYVTALTLFPTIFLIYASLLDWQLLGTRAAGFTGLANYVSALTSPAFQTSMLITLEMGVAITAIELTLGIGVALMLNRNNPLSAFIRNSLIIPLMMTPFQIYMNWKYLLTAGVGPVPYLFGVLFNNPNVQFFSTVPWVYVTLIVLDIWQWLPFVIIIMLAGLRSLPREPFEAAEIDGASNWAKFRYLTLPLLRPILAVIILFRLVDSFKIFESISLFTHGGPGTATSFMGWLLYQTGLGIVQNVGLSSAYAVIFLIVILATTWTLMYYLYKSIRG